MVFYSRMMFNILEMMKKTIIHKVLMPIGKEYMTEKKNKS